MYAIYDFHPTEEDLMGETSVHAGLVHYLMEVLNLRLYDNAGQRRLTQAEALAEKLRLLGIDPNQL